MALVAVILVMFLYGMTAATLGTILPDISCRFHLTPHQNGTIALSQALGLILASASAGALSDAKGEKIVLVSGVIIILFSITLLPRAANYTSVVLLMLALGLGGGTAITGANTLADSVSGAHHGSILNLVNLFFGLGGFIVPFIAANVFSRDRTRLCYIVAGFTMITLIVEIIAPMQGSNGYRHFLFGDLGRVLGRPSVLLLGLLLFLYVSCEVSIWNWLPRHLMAQGISEPWALNILSVGFALGLLVGRALASSILIHISALTVVLVSSIMMAIITFLMLRAKKPVAALFLVALTGFSMAPVYPTVLAIVGEASPFMSGTAIGFAITSGWIGLAVSSRLIGSIAGTDPSRLRKALMIVPGSSVLMVILVLLVSASF